jgi:hypothetical protein
MGSFYTNITLRCTDHAGIITYLDQLGRRAYVLPPCRGYVVVCEAESDEQGDEIALLSAQLSRQFECLAFGVLNHDDDVLTYQLYSNGALLDEYDSMPGYYDTSRPPEPAGGQAATLCEVFNKPRSAARIEAILRNVDYVFASERHEDLMHALGMPLTQLGYSMLSREDESTDGDRLCVKVPTRTLLRQFTEATDVIKPFDLIREVRVLIRKNKMISAVVLYQTHKRCTLEEARHFVESL